MARVIQKGSLTHLINGSLTVTGLRTVIGLRIDLVQQLVNIGLVDTALVGADV